jgi:hypothetical protein
MLSGLITMDSPTREAYLYEHEGAAHMAMVVLADNFTQI